MIRSNLTWSRLKLSHLQGFGSLDHHVRPNYVIGPNLGIDQIMHACRGREAPHRIQGFTAMWLYRGTSLMSKYTLLALYRRPMPRLQLAF